MASAVHDLAQVLIDLDAILKEYKQQENFEKFIVYSKMHETYQSLEHFLQRSRNIFHGILDKPRLISSIQTYMMQKLQKDLENTLPGLQQDDNQNNVRLFKYDNSSDSLDSSVDETSKLIGQVRQGLSKLGKSFQKFKNIREQTSQNQVSIFSLVKIAFQKGFMDPQLEIDLFLIKIFALSQSISLVFQKARYVLSELLKRQPQMNSENSQALTTSSKRSALSMSLEIYKQKQKMQRQMQRGQSPIWFQGRTVHKIVVANYHMSAKRQYNKEAKAAQMSRCCS